MNVTENQQNKDQNMVGNEVWTSHLDCAAALVVHGHTCKRMNTDNPYKVQFFFEETPDGAIQKAMDEHHAGNLTVSSLKYHNAMRDIRERISYFKNRSRNV